MAIEEERKRKLNEKLNKSTTKKNEKKKTEIEK